MEYGHTDSDEIKALGTDTSVVVTPQVVSAGNYTAALMSDGTVWTWGDNTYGQLGVGAGVSGMAYAMSPMQVVARTVRRIISPVL